MTLRKGGPARAKTRSSVPRAIREAGLAVRHSLGQHFLVDSNALDSIVEASALGPHDVVVEIGAGPGVLTQRIVGADRTVVACEIDRDLLSFARTRVAGDGVVWVEGDALDTKGRLGP